MYKFVHRFFIFLLYSVILRDDFVLPSGYGGPELTDGGGEKDEKNYYDSWNNANSRGDHY